MAERPSISVNLTALGVPVRVMASGSAAETLASAVREAWAWCLDEAPPPETPDVVDVVLDDDEAVVDAARGAGGIASTSLDAVMDALSPAVTLKAISRQAGRLLMLHGCALADPATGRTTALVGPSGAGKTTAARVLSESFMYVTDETVGVTADLAIVPYPKPMSVAHGRGPKAQLGPVAFAQGPPDRNCHLAQVLILHRNPDGANVATLERVATIRALARLAPETSFLSRLEHPLHRLADAARAGLGVHTARYREAGQLPDLLSSMLGRA